LRLVDLSSLPGVLAINGDAEVDSVTLDSRQVNTGSVFVASKGLSLDGHDFVKDALNCGAAVAVERLDVFEKCSPAILVEKSEDAVWRLCKKIYGDPSAKLKIIGVTGTNGKTTVAWMLRQALEALRLKTAYIGTLGAYIDQELIETGLTTPFSPDINSFLSKCIQSGVEYVTMEVSSHALAQKRVDGIEFDVAVFTNLSQDHLDFHANLADYFEAKLRLFGGLPSEKPLKCVVNLDDEYGGKINCTGIRHGTKSGDVRLISSQSKLDCLEMVVEYANASYEIKVPMGGRFNVDNALSVFCSLLVLGFSADAAVTSLKSVKGAPGRFQAIASKKDFVVLVDYAHTPDALEKVLRTAREMTEGKLLCVFGCGGDRDKSKRPRMGAAASAIADIVWVTSDNPRTEDPNSIIDDILPGISGANVRIEVDRRKAIHGAIQEAARGDCVIIAGKGHENYQIIGREKRYFDDSEVAAEALS
jgi:UDP-N-acetylmuramoyl-L-alanyl-D-glutamate--2,6-diaminopimelate ligase